MKKGRTQTISFLPEVLVVHPTRCNRTKHIGTRVSIPDVLDLTPYLLK